MDRKASLRLCGAYDRAQVAAQLNKVAREGSPITYFVIADKGQDLAGIDSNRHVHTVTVKAGFSSMLKLIEITRLEIEKLISSLISAMTAAGRSA